MSIDRIGKGGGASGPSGAAGTGAPTAPSSTGQTFEVKRSDRPPAPGTVSEVKPAATPLASLRAGHIDVNGYMDLKVSEATSHLQGLKPSELDTIRRMLRDKLSSDPALSDLVRGATGQVPVPQDD